MADKETHTSENAKLYELGFHILPTVTEDKVTDVYNDVTGIINKYGGSIVKTGEPKAIKLAYTITKKVKGQNERFNSAYFAWIKFDSNSEEIEKIKAEIDSNEDLLRYLIIKTVDDDEKSTIKLVEEENEEEEGIEEAEKKDMDSEVVVDTSEEVEEKKEEVSDEEIDEVIDEITEDK
jgi:ribosomal protein S6